MTQSETIEDYAKLIMRKLNWNDTDESKRLEIMNTMLMCFGDILDGKNRCKP